MSVFLVLILAFFAGLSHGAAEPLLIGQYRGRTERGEHCIYSILEDRIDGESPEIQVHVQGPPNIGNFDIKILPEHLPLKESRTITVLNDGRLFFRDGQVFYQEVRDLGFWNFTDEIEEVELEVDAYLGNPKSLRIDLYEKFFWREDQPIKSLVCIFGNND